MTQEFKPKILLHVCCATCSPYVLKTLSKEFEPTIYYYHPNMQPTDEYRRRLLVVVGYVLSLGYEFIDAAYDDERWFFMSSGLEDDHEGGKRCSICFRMRMNKVALYAAVNGFKWFATTLTVSPHKNSKLINRTCRELARDYGLNFYDVDFKKKDGAKISFKMSRELGFYHQDYCGCVYSLQERRETHRLREEAERQSRQMSSPVNIR